MKILGIDPALTVTGYGLIDSRKGKLCLIEAGIIKTSPNNSMPQRLEKVYRSLFRLCDEARPDVMVLEKIYAHYRHPTTAYLLGEVRGVICLLSAHKNIPLFEYAATRVKKAIIGGGLASKARMQRMVCDILRIDKLPKYTDVTDALALAIAYSYIAKVRQLLPQEYKGR
jgi:crossover junction endodeoxyribonuclease RuvC